jgi:phosphohistidine phosphatase SixA
MRKLHLILILCLVCAGIGFSQTTIILTRHAEKVESKDRDPGLSFEGQQRAKKLASTLSVLPLTAIYSTDYVRTKGTVEPLAEAKHLEIQLYDPRDARFIENVLIKEKGGMVVISGHSNTIPTMINQLAHTNYPSYSEKEYDNLVFVILQPENEPMVIWLKHQ